MMIKGLISKWNNLKISNDVMFGMVMENRDICLKLIQCAVPELNVTKIKFNETQRTINGPIDARGSRFDVYAQDEKGRVFVIEMQVANRHNLPYRLRYYQDQIDYDLLKVGDDYDKLSEYPTYVIIFCDFDYYGRGWSKYSFQCRCDRDPKLTADDGQHKVIFNAKADDFHDSIEIGNFLKLMENQPVMEDPLVSQVVQEMERIKQDPERRKKFMSYEMNLMDARAEGKAEGIAEGKIEGRAQGKIEGIAEGRKETIKTTAQLLFEYEPDREKVIQKLMNKFNLSYDKVKQYVE